MDAIGQTQTADSVLLPVPTDTFEKLYLSPKNPLQDPASHPAIRQSHPDLSHRGPDGVESVDFPISIPVGDFSTLVPGRSQRIRQGDNPI